MLLNPAPPTPRLTFDGEGEARPARNGAAGSDQDEETGERPNSSSTSSVSVKLERRHTDEVEVEFEIRQASERKRRRNERHRESEDEEGFTVLSRECDSRRVLRSPADYYRMVTRDAWAPGAHMTLVQVAGECR
jgi:hypothetical protein